MVLKNALVLKSWDDEIEPLDVVVKNGTIVRLGKVEEDGIDLSGKLIMPPFHNTHTHAAMTLMRSLSDDDPFDVWLFEKILPLEDKLDGSMVYWGTMVAMMEMVSRGIVAFVDMYFYLDDVIRAVLDFGMRAIITRGLVDSNGDDNGRLEENIKAFERWHGEKGLVKVGLGPHSPYTCSLNYLNRIADVARVNNMFVTMHLRETKWEKERYDLEKILRIFENIELLAVHMVHVGEEEMGVLKTNGVKISHNPSSNLKLGNGVAPIREYVERGIDVGLGTDGCASNNSLDVWHEMRLCSLLQKSKDPTSLSAETSLRMATQIGAEITGFGSGRISEGEPADLIVVDIEKPHYHPKDRLKSHLVHSGNSGDVFATMVNGRWVYYDGGFPTVDEIEVLKNFERSFKKLME